MIDLTSLNRKINETSIYQVTLFNIYINIGKVKQYIIQNIKLPHRLVDPETLCKLLFKIWGTVDFFSSLTAVNNSETLNIQICLFFN